MSEGWIWYTGMFTSGSVADIVIASVLGVLITILCLWLAFGIIKFSFWLAVEIVKASFLGSAIIIYTCLTLFILAPIALLAQEKDLPKVIDTYIIDIRNAICNFYPKLEAKIDDWIAKYGNSHKNMHKMSSSIPNGKSSKYFCSNCGVKFTKIMNNALNVKNSAYCEKCGKHYNLHQGILIPITK